MKVFTKTIGEYVSIPIMSGLLVGLLLVVIPASITIQAQSEDLRFQQAKWQPDGNLIAFEGDDRIFLYNDQLEYVHTLILPPIPAELPNVDILDITWSPNGTKFAASIYSSDIDAQSVRFIVWESATWEIVVELFNATRTVEFSPDNENRYIAFPANLGVVIYDLQNEEIVNEIPLFGAISLYWNPANIDELAVALAVSDPNQVKVVNPFTGQIIEELPYSVGIWPAYSPDGSYLAVGRYDSTNIPIVDVLDTTTYTTISSLIHDHGLYEEADTIFWLNNGEIGTSSYFGEAIRWDVTTGVPFALDVMSDRSRAFWKQDGTVLLARSFYEPIGEEAILIFDGYTGEVQRGIRLDGTPIEIED